MAKKSPHKPAPRRISRAYWLTSLAVVVIAVALFVVPYIRTGNRTASETDSTLVISMAGWQPALLEAKAGTPVTVTMVNLDNQFHTDGGGWHNFVVPALGIEERVGPKLTRSFTFTVEQAGEYQFYCDICCGGKDNPYMQGKLIVS